MKLKIGDGICNIFYNSVQPTQQLGFIAAHHEMAVFSRQHLVNMRRFEGLYFRWSFFQSELMKSLLDKELE